MPEFKKISDIDMSRPQSWRDNIFLTIDIDWAHDDVLSYTIDLVEKADVCATWFVTHETDLLSRLRGNKKFELAVHPNFNFLLSGIETTDKTAADVMDSIMTIVPEAVSVRSHSMTQSTNLMRLFYDRGLKYDCNHFIPHQSRIELAPWMTWNGLVKVPYFWEDDIACIYNETDDLTDLASASGLRVFDFHPIHVYLNTDKMERYENCRNHHRNPVGLKVHVYDGLNGTQDKFKRLLGIN